MLALMVEQVGPGDAVFVPAFTFVATAGAVARLNATPVFVDVRRDTFNMDTDSLEGAIGEAKRRGLKPRCIIAVDLFGQPADYRAIDALAGRHDQPRRRPDRVQRGRALRHQRLLAVGLHQRGFVEVEAFGEAAQDLGDLRLDLLVEDQLAGVPATPAAQIHLHTHASVLRVCLAGHARHARAIQRNEEFIDPSLEGGGEKGV